MLSTLGALIKFITSFLYYSLAFSYGTGHTIVSVLSYIYNLTGAGVRCTTGVLKILFDDFGLFLSDLSERIGAIVRLLYTGLEASFTIVGKSRECLESVFGGVATGFVSVGNFFEKVAMALGHLIMGLKYLLITLGSGVWFLLTIVPVGLVYVNVLTTYYIGRLLEETWNSIRGLLDFILNIVSFFIDVPFEASVGIICAVCIAYVLSKFNVILFKKLKKAAVRFSKFFKARPQNKPTVKRSMSKDDFEDTINCLICKEKQKCILFLPCKHLCVCNECVKRLPRFRPQCPMCRTNVLDTMKVYI